MPEFLVTGAAGFIGASVSELLLKQGHTVCGIDNLNHAYDVRMKEHRLSRLQEYEGFHFTKVDISDRDALWEALDAWRKSGVSLAAIINLAARAGVRASLENPWVYYQTNVTGTLNLLEYAHRHHIRKFILASTSSVYGENAPLPTPETADSDHPLQPYASSKKGAETLAHVYHYLYDIDVTVVRYFTVYGPSGRPDMSMFRFVQWISEGRTLTVFGDGEQSRGFTYIDDIARGTVQALKPLGYEIINLGGHETITINQLISLIEQKIGKKAMIEYAPRHPADMLANHANVDKARRLLGWEPQVNLDRGVSQLVAWYMENRRWAKDIDTTP